MNNLTENERKLLYELLARAFIFIRHLGWSEDIAQAKQAADLADAFHRLPYELADSEFDWDSIIGDISTYQNKYPVTQDEYSNFLSLIKNIRNTSNKNK